MQNQKLGALLDLGSHKVALTITGLVLLLIVIIAALSSIWPKQEEWFFELGLLGKNKTADEYFSDPHSIVKVGSTNNWFIYVHNHMAAAKAISIRIKLLNSTMQLPDDRNHQPSQAETITEFPFSLPDNETAIIPFSWSIADAQLQNGSAVITRILINEQPVKAQLSDSSKSSFEIVFELWVQDQPSGEYQFSWQSKKGLLSTSVYIGFVLDFTEA